MTAMSSSLISKQNCIGIIGSGLRSSPIKVTFSQLAATQDQVRNTVSNINTQLADLNTERLTVLAATYGQEPYHQGCLWPQSG